MRPRASALRSPPPHPGPGARGEAAETEITLFSASDRARFSRLAAERLWQIGNAVRLIAFEIELSTYRSPPFSNLALFVTVPRGLSRANSAVAEPSIVLGEHTSPCFKTMHRILASRLS